MRDDKKNLITFDYTTDRVKALTEEIIADYRASCDKYLQLKPEELNYANVYGDFEKLESRCSTLTNIIYLLSMVSKDKEIRDTTTESTAKIEEVAIELQSRIDLYKVFKDAKKSIESTKILLSGTQKRYMERIMRDYERNGLSLEDSKRERLMEIRKKLSTIQIQFSKNINDENSVFKFTKEELEGIPEDFFEGLEKEEKDGKTYYNITLKYPHVFPILEKCSITETRKKIELEFSSRCKNENIPLLDEALLLRQEYADIMGYNTYADFELVIKMAKTTDTVMNFLNDLVEKLDKPAKEDVQVLLKEKEEFLKSKNEKSDGVLNVYDWRFYESLILKKKYQVDNEEIKQYFPVDVVLKGILHIYQVVLGLRFEIIPKEHSNVWQEDVIQYEVYDKETNEFVGHFYLDLYPREGKYNHYCEIAIRKHAVIEGEVVHPAAACICNFPKPTEGKPSLLNFQEVQTFFHEFGHVMHDICSKSPLMRFSGTSVEIDFVEAPSQMLENWCYYDETLDIISGHYQDHSKKLPAELRKKLLDTRNFLEPLKNRRQLVFALSDMMIHTTKGKIDTKSLYIKLMKEIGLCEPQTGSNFFASFGHIFGYDAGYYGYLWSKSYSCDMFSKFEKNGILNPAIGKEYRDIVLATGQCKDSIEVIKEFLGREPNNEAFLDHLGIKN